MASVPVTQKMYSTAFSLPVSPLFRGTLPTQRRGGQLDQVHVTVEMVRSIGVTGITVQPKMAREGLSYVAVEKTRRLAGEAPARSTGLLFRDIQFIHTHRKKVTY